MTRKLNDVAHQKQLASIAVPKLWTVWLRRSHICLQLRLWFYASFVVPLFTYNMGTWGLMKSELEHLDAYHCCHLHQAVGIHWPHRISKEALCHHCQCRHNSEAILTARCAPYAIRCSSSARHQQLFRGFRRHVIQGSTADDTVDGVNWDLLRIGCKLHCPPTSMPCAHSTMDSGDSWGGNLLDLRV